MIVPFPIVGGCPVSSWLVRHSLTGRARNPVPGDFQDDHLRHKIVSGFMRRGSLEFAGPVDAPIGQEILHALFD